jgi:hypothetical protein
MVTCDATCSSFTWENKSGNLPNIPVDSIIANNRFPQQVFAGTDWGLYFTNDITADEPEWFRFQAGLPNVMIWDMAIDADATTLALFTRSRGAYAWPLPDSPIPTSVEVSRFTGEPGSSGTNPMTLLALVALGVAGVTGATLASYCRKRTRA